jgi:hypothetical protein
MRILGKAYNYLAAPGEFVENRRFLELFKRVKADWNYFTIEHFKPGTSSEAKLRDYLDAQIFGEK